MSEKLLILFLFLTSLLSAQTSYFVKYKESLPISEVHQKVEQRRLLPEGDQPLMMPAATDVRFFARGMAREIPGLQRILFTTFASELSASDITRLLNADPAIEYIQANTVYSINGFSADGPNDSLFAQQWGLHRIKAPAAWSVSSGNPAIIIGVIDTGVDYLHPDLDGQIWLNAGEIGTDTQGNDKRSNGIDDDGNGFIDDFRGWDFTDRAGFPFDSSGGDYLNWDNDPMDENTFSHGTAVSGIISAKRNNLLGISGIVPESKIMAVRAFDPGGFGEEDDVAAAILYATVNGAKVINMSFGDYSFSYVLRDVIRFASAQGVVLVASSGNSGSAAPHYPSGYSEVISVGNSMKSDYPSGNSNYGSTLDLIAPGTEIPTLARRYQYSLFSGTSAAAPHVSAAAALLLSIQQFSAEEIKQILKSSCDDIGDPGWDIRSGAGRLNLERAVRVLSPASIMFSNPKQDFATSGAPFPVIASVLSPYFESYSLYYGRGLNPTTWTPLVENIASQKFNDTLAMVNVASEPDTVFALRLVVKFINGSTTEERVNFHKMSTASKAELISVIPSYYGNKPTILAAIYSEQPAIARMYYRENSTLPFRFIALDGFAVNNQFVRQLHYGFLPQDIVDPDKSYQIYFEVENLVGLKTTLLDENDQYFVISSPKPFQLRATTKLQASLPAGYLYEKPVALKSVSEKEVLHRRLSTPTVLNMYSFENNQFVYQNDSLSSRIPKASGDFNKNGKTDILSLWTFTTLIDEQSQQGSTQLQNRLKADTSFIWPMLVDDVNNDGSFELLALTDDSTISVYSFNQDLKITRLTSFKNFSKKKYQYNRFDAPYGVIVDSDKNGRNELWMVDMEGDIMSWEIASASQFIPKDTIVTGYGASSAMLSVGDFDGDGGSDFGIVLRSIDEIDIAPYNRVIIYNLKGNTFNVLYDHAFIDPATEFRSSFQRASNALKFADLDNNGTEELIVSTFPYMYILQYQELTQPQVILYEENVNTTSLYLGDINENGVLELALPKTEGISFIELGESNRTATPYNLRGYSTNATSVQLVWHSDAIQHYLFRGSSVESMVLYDSTFEKSFRDQNVTLNTAYWYSVQAYNPLKPVPLSGKSTPVRIYHHKPSQIESVELTSPSSMLVNFSGRIMPTIENLEAIQVSRIDSLTGIEQKVYRISSMMPAGETSYLLSLTQPLESGWTKIKTVALRDFYGSPVPLDSLVFKVTAQQLSDQFFIESFKILNSRLIELTFNLPVDPVNYSITSNYEFEPANSVSSVTMSGNTGNTIRLNLSQGNPIGAVGREYRLKVRNLTSTTETGSIPIASGAGSVVVLTSNETNFDNIYVYPSPALLKDGQGSVTIAGIPNNCSVIILDVNGNIMRRLEETDGNGGVSWDLRDTEGRMVATGIYIYRIAKLDSKKEETDVKLGKIAVVR